MARKSREAAAASKASIVREAAKLFRLKGYEGTSLDDVMKAAGLTVGTFYAHFSSKADLFRAVLELGNRSSYETFMPPSARDTRGDRWLTLFLHHYLTARHRDSVQTGCYFPTLAPDVARSGMDARRVFEEVLKAMVHGKGTEVENGASLGDAEERVLSSFCLAVGALALSRAVASKRFSKRILDAARARCVNGLR